MIDESQIPKEDGFYWCRFDDWDWEVVEIVVAAPATKRKQPYLYLVVFRTGLEHSANGDISIDAAVWGPKLTPPND